MTFSACPGCGFNKQKSLLSGSYFNIYQCGKCRSRYCYECKGSNGGRKCPRCSAAEKQQVGSVQLR